MDSIFTNLILEKENEPQILECRKVCHLWNQVATKLLHKKSTRVLTFGEQSHYTYNKDLKAFMKMLKQFENEFPTIPVTHFRMLPCVFQVGHDQLLQDFVHFVSPFVCSFVFMLDIQSTLHFNEWNNYDLNSQTCTLSKLRSLCFDFRRLKATDMNFVEYFLSRGKNCIETLTFIHPAETIFEDGEERAIINAKLIQLFNMTVLPRLKTLKLDISLTNELLASLSAFLAHSNISALELSIRNSRVNKEDLFGLLQVVAPCLESLSFQRLGPQSNIVFKFPTMRALTHLEFQGWENVVTDVHFCPFDYNQQFPKLVSLELNTWSEDSSWRQFFPNQTPVLENERRPIKNLKLPSALHDPSTIFQSYGFFINLRSLAVCFSLRTAPLLVKVFQLLGNIHELRLCKSIDEVHSAINVDYLFTGLPASECEKVLKSKSYVNQRCRRMERKPSLIDLKSKTS